MAAALHLSLTEDFVAWAGNLVLVWVVGLALGWLLPRPRWVRKGWSARTALLATPLGVWFKRAALAWNGALVLRELWYNFVAPGTFRGMLRTAWLALTAQLGIMQLAAVAAADDALPAKSGFGAAPAAAVAAAPEDDWPVGEAELQYFKQAVAGAGEGQGASFWQEMMRKEWPGCSYTAWRRTLACGKAEYKSITLQEDASAEEFMDFYFDDDTRASWDNMIAQHSLVENSNAERRCQVVRWLRQFPFAFISQREYIIARRMFKEEDGSLYAVTKGVEHPAAPRQPNMVRMANFHSHWRSRTVPCPRGTDRPACETMLLHFEDFQIPENLARFAVRHGMAGFVKKMVPAVRQFVTERRARCDAFAPDSAAYGLGRVLAPLPAPAIERCPSTSSQSCVSDSAYGESVAGDSASERSMRLHRSSSARKLGLVMAASAVAIALAGSGVGNRGGGGGAPRGKHARTHHGHKHHAAGHKDGGSSPPPSGGKHGHRHRQHTVLASTAELAEAPFLLA